MQRFLPLAVAVSATLGSLSANATVIDAHFSGTVQSQTDTAYAVSDAISGEFLFDTVSGSYLSFVIGGQSVAAGFASLAAITPDQYTALYQAQVSPVAQGGSLNSSFTVDLEGIGKWAGFDAIALLQDGGQLAANLDTGLSSFGYYVANADGSGVHQLSAAFTSLNVSTVPEPAPYALLLAAAAAFGLRRHLRAR